MSRDVVVVTLYTHRPHTMMCLHACDDDDDDDDDDDVKKNIRASWRLELTGNYVRQFSLLLLLSP